MISLDLFDQVVQKLKERMREDFVSRRRIRLFDYLFLAVFLLLSSVSHAQFGIGGGGGNESVFPDLGDIQKRYNSHELSALTNDLAGDHIVVDTGALSFTTTDVSIPGNNGLAVEFTRTLSRDRSGERWGDWVISTPSISRNYVQEIGNNLDRCTGDLTPDAYIDWGPFIPVPAGSYWHGYNLKIPGRSPGKLGGYASGGSSAEFSGTNARMVTKNNWVLKCGVAADDGGDGYEVTAPNGDIYTFDRVTTRVVRGFEVGYYDSSKPTPTQGNPTAPNSSRTFQMMEETLLASEVRDVHGNTVTYSSSGISSSDGRTITFGGSSSSRTVTANGRTWTYTISGNNLTQVTLPDGRKWLYSTSGAWLSESQDGICANYHSTSVPPITVTHPSGTQVMFDQTVIKNSRTYVDVVHSDPGTPEPTVLACHLGNPNYVTASGFYSWAVTDKTITMPGETPYAYNWDYEEDFGSYNNSSSHPSDTKKRTVTDPLGHKSVYYFNRRNSPKEGNLEKIEILPSGSSTPLQTTTHNYLLGNSVGADFTGVGFAQLSNGASTRRIYKTSTVITQNGDTFTTNYGFETNPAHANFAYNSPKSVSTSSNVSTSARVRAMTYEHKKPKWILSLPKTVSLNGLQQISYTYDVDGQQTAQSRYGQADFTTFGYNSDGTLAWYKDALQRQTTAQLWKRGTPQKVIQPDQSYYEQNVDNNGWLTSVKDPMGRIDTYTHDNMGRVTLVNPHGSWANTSISYSFPSTGGATQTITTGQSRQTITYNGMYRPTLKRAQALDTGWSSYVNTSYDALNRPVFKSQPSLSSSETKGVNYTYDALGRALTVAENVAPYATTTNSYHASHRHRVTDPSGAYMDYYSFGYDGPGNKDYRAMYHSSGQRTTLHQNTYGELTRIQQWGTQSVGGSMNKSQHLYYDNRRRVCRYYTVESGATKYEYNDAGEMIRYAKGQGDSGCLVPNNNSRVSQTYDLMGRPLLTTFQHGGTPNITRTYDLNGNVKTINRGGVNWAYNYNDADLLTNETLTLDGKSFPLTYNYNTSKHMTRRTYPTGLATDFLPDGLGRSQAAKNGSIYYANNVSYHANGAVASMTYGNGQAFTQTLNNRLLPQRLLAVNGGTQALDLTYTYDARAKVTSVIDAAISGNNRSYGYDALGRMTSASGPWGSSTAGYDVLNNIRSRNLGSRNITVNYDIAKNRANQSADSISTGSGGTGTRTVDYDIRGNVTTLGTLAMTYDYSDQPTNISGTANGIGSAYGSYLYDGNLKRVRSIVNGETIYNVYDASGALVHVEKIAGGGQTAERSDYVKAGGKAIARVVKNGPVYYSYSDHLGSPVTTITSNNSNGTGTNAINRERYTPFGIAMDNPSVLSDQAGFTGHIKDSTTGLNYMQARYYDPVMGRFLSIDPVTFMHTGNPAYFNRYAYAGNDPVNNIDAFGTCFGPAAIPCGVGGRVAVQKGKNKLLVPATALAAVAVYGGAAGDLDVAAGFYDIGLSTLFPNFVTSDSAEPFTTPGGREIAHGKNSEGYIEGKGWTPEEIDDAIDNPAESYGSKNNHRTGKEQTTHVDGDGNWVTVDSDGKVTQVNEKGNDRQPRPEPREEE